MGRTMILLVQRMTIPMSERSREAHIFLAVLMSNADHLHLAVPSVENHGGSHQEDKSKRCPVRKCLLTISARLSCLLLATVIKDKSSFLIQCSGANDVAVQKRLLRE